MKATGKLSWDQPGPYVVLEADPFEEDIAIELVPEIVPTRTLLRSGVRMSVSVLNATSQPVSLKPWMLIGKVIAATPVTVDDLVQKDNGKEPSVWCPILFPRWEEKIRAQLARWEQMFSKNDFDVGCDKSAQHQIRLSEDKPFSRERA